MMLFRLYSTTHYLLSFIKLWTLFGIICFTDAQKLPERDENRFSFPEDNMFLENFVLPHSQEVSYYLFHNESKNFFFIVKESRTPLAITVIPCASKLEWNVRYLRNSSNRRGKFDPFKDTKRRVGKRGKRKLLHSFSGHNSMTFRRDSSRKGTYMLQIRALDSDTFIKLYGTTSPDSDLSYPALPNGDDVGVTAVTKRSFSVAWKPSPDAKFIKKLMYCVGINRKHHYKTHCSLSSHMYGDVKPTFSPNWGFWFPWEKGKKKSLRQKAKPVKPAPSGSIVYKCIGNKTNFTFNKARPGRKYYIDVYVVNRRTNRSSTYGGVGVKTRQADNHLVLQAGKVIEKSIRKESVPQMFHFDVNKPTKELFIFIHPCSGSVNIEVWRGDNITFQAKVVVPKSFILKDVDPGIYIIKVYGPRGQSFRIQVKSGSSRLRYPTLPENTEVKVLENLITCNSVTLAWMGTKGKQTYCVYKRTQIEKRNDNEYKKYNQCVAPMKTMQKIHCAKRRHRHSRRAVLSQKISDLQSGTSYIFDIFVRRGRRNYLHYKTSLAKTKHVCAK